jgi:hypothetical protein
MPPTSLQFSFRLDGLRVGEIRVKCGHGGASLTDLTCAQLRPTAHYTGGVWSQRGTYLNRIEFWACHPKYFARSKSLSRPLASRRFESVCRFVRTQEAGGKQKCHDGSRAMPSLSGKVRI